MARQLSGILIAALLSAGCASEPQRIVDTVEVRVPVEQLVLPPAELTEPVPRPESVFVAPPDAVIGLTEAGVTYLKRLISDRAALGAWVLDLDR